MGAATMKTIWVAMFISCLVGVIQIYFGFAVFSFVINHAMPLEWLADLGLRGTQLTIGVAIVDLLIAIVISIPAALILLWLQPQKPLVYVTIAVMTGLLITNGSLIVNPTPLIEYWPRMIPGWINVLLPIPLVVICLQKVIIPDSPNKSINTEASEAGSGLFRR